MTENFKVTHTGTGCFILVQNYPVFNQISNYYFSDIKYIIKDYYSVGMWKIKQLKN
mgnify:CR=1 FL=1